MKSVSKRCKSCRRFFSTSVEYGFYKLYHTLVIERVTIICYRPVLYRVAPCSSRIWLFSIRHLITSMTIGASNLTPFAVSQVSTANPPSLLMTVSFKPPHAVPITGSPALIASICDKPKFSSCVKCEINKSIRCIEHLVKFIGGLPLLYYNVI